MHDGMNLLNRRHAYLPVAGFFLCSLGMSRDSAASDLGRQLLAIFEALSEDAALRVVAAKYGALEQALSEVSVMLAQLRETSTSTVAPHPEPLSDPGWLTTAEGAAELGYHPKYVQYLCRSGALRAVQAVPGGHWRIHPDDVDAYRRGEKPKGRRRGPRNTPRSRRGR
jgi:excisionase family DNA binding protein